MKHYTYFLGVDISKKTMDVALQKLGETGSIHRKFANNDEGMEELLPWLKASAVDLSETLFCMETTGLYCFPLTQFLTEQGIDIWIEHAAQIKKSNALSRGKNDKTDAQRIAAYAAKNLDRLRLWKPLPATLEKIKHLARLRERLVETKKKLLTPIHEFEDVGNSEMAALLTKSIHASLTAIDKDLLKVEAKIISIVDGDENLKKLYKVITSVVGIGFVTAINLLIYTQGFTVMNDARKLACYSGVAPFEYSSGSSIRGRTKVHFMANRQLKCNLHMASLAAVKFDMGLKAYYERKVAEGKNKMSVLNAVRNKLLARVVACVNNNRLYVDNFA